MTKEEHETLQYLLAYLYDFARKQDDATGKWDYMSRRLKQILEWLSGGELDDSFFYDSPKQDITKVVDFKHLDEAFQKIHEQLDAKEIHQCSNANLNKGICPAARDTFYRLMAEHEAEYFNIPEEKRETFIKDYMSGKTRNEKQN